MSPLDAPLPAPVPSPVEAPTRSTTDAAQLAHVEEAAAALVEQTAAARDSQQDREQARRQLEIDAQTILARQREELEWKIAQYRANAAIQRSDGWARFALTFGAVALIGGGIAVALTPNTPNEKDTSR